ncbi:hypothetical protein RJ640_000858, partial [Escallonia rubra]
MEIDRRSVCPAIFLFLILLISAILLVFKINYFILSIVIICIICIFVVRKIVVRKKSEYEENEEDYLDQLPGMPTRFSFRELESRTENFSCKLGEGGFGSVFQGSLSNGIKVAVKQLDGIGQLKKKSFLAEVETIGSIHHVSLVRLVGFCAEKSYRLLVYEYMGNGSLDKWIFHGNEGLALGWLSRRKIIFDIAKGLAYLHEECRQKIYHLDIKPQNILLDEYFNAKVSDFGLSKLIDKDQSQVMTTLRGTPGYMAPEWLSSVITEKVDVYSFGVVILEILCGRRNLDRSQPEEDMHLLSIFKRKAEEEQLLDMIDKCSEDMQAYAAEVVQMMSVAAWCLQSDFARRPSMSVVVKVLEGLVDVEGNLNYDFTQRPETHGAPVTAHMEDNAAGAGTLVLPCLLSGPRKIVVRKKSEYEENEEDYLDQLPGMPTRFSFRELESRTENFSCKLGEGGFGSVFQGSLSNGIKVAVKQLDGIGQIKKKSFLAEVETIGSIHHVSLVRLVGFCAEKSYRLLVYEYMANGSLDKWIFHGNEGLALGWLSRRKIIFDIAKGLAYLHEECRQKIYHLDIKPQNILLDEYFNAKVSDFGLSKLIDKDQSQVMTTLRGTPGYMAPEWLSSVITEKVDVYSFGVVLLEILCGRRNLDRSQPEEDMHLLSIFKRKAEEEQLLDMIDKCSEDMQANAAEVVQMMSVAAWCLQSDFARRPSMSVVVKVLEGLVDVEGNLNYDFTKRPETHGAPVTAHKEDNAAGA